jgi:hypothetical protein
MFIHVRTKHHQLTQIMHKHGCSQQCKTLRVQKLKFSLVWCKCRIVAKKIYPLLVAGIRFSSDKNTGLWPENLRTIGSSFPQNVDNLALL